MRQSDGPAKLLGRSSMLDTLERQACSPSSWLVDRQRREASFALAVLHEQDLTCSYSNTCGAGCNRVEDWLSFCQRPSRVLHINGLSTAAMTGFESLLVRSSRMTVDRSAAAQVALPSALL